MNTDAISTFFALSAIVILLMVAAMAIIWVAATRSQAAAGWKATITASLGGQALTLAWIVALTAMLGSLYFSEVAHFTPCEYCWYQRIAMYPLALILGIAAYRSDRGIRRYALPMVTIGAIISAYHYLLQHFPELASTTCSATAPCTAAWVWEFGFVSIPFMALACFSAIAALLVIAGQSTAGNE